MKATLDLPDDLYRRVKARSAMEGRPVRSVAVQLFQNWLDAPPSASLTTATVTPAPSARKPTRFDKAPWLAISAKHIKHGMSHEMDEIRAAIARSWAAETAKKLPATLVLPTS